MCVSIVYVNWFSCNMVLQMEGVFHTAESSFSHVYKLNGYTHIGIHILYTCFQLIRLNLNFKKKNDNYISTISLLQNFQ